MRIRTKALNVLVLQKGQEFFAYVFPDEAIGRTRFQLEHDAKNPSLSLDWHDAGVLSKRIRAIEQFITDQEVTE